MHFHNSNMAVNCLYIPNVEEFFNDFLQLIQWCNECLQGGANEGLTAFFGRCLDEYQRSLRVMYCRLRDFRNNLDDLLNDFEHLLNMVGQIKNSLESLYSNGNVGELPVNDALCTTVNDGLAGRPHSKFRNIVLFLERSNVFNCTNDILLYCLHAVYLPLINQTLAEFLQWNDHPVTTECNYSPRQTWVQGMLQLRNNNLTAVRNVVG